jgi:hypothetical protein
LEAGVIDAKTKRGRLKLTNGNLSYKVSNWSTCCEIGDCVKEPIRCRNNLGRKEFRNLNMKSRTYTGKVSYLCATVVNGCEMC